MTAQIQLRKLVLLGLDHLIDFVVTSEEAGVDKPHAPIFALALEKAQCQSTEAIMVGDSFSHDVMGACAVGIRSVWIHRNPNQLPPETELSYIEVHTFEEVAEQIRMFI